MIEKKQSNNYKIMRQIQSKLRHTESSPDLAYLLIFSFLYKYCSDILKDHFLAVIQNQEITFDEAYMDRYQRDIFINDAYHMFGYYIESSNAFIDDVVNSKYQNDNFIQEFISAFTNNIRFFNDSNYQKYFEFIFETVYNEFNVNRFGIDSRQNLILKDLIYEISRLDIFEDRYPFKRVFDKVCSSRFVSVESEFEYTTKLISELSASIVEEPKNVYNPFSKDGSSLIGLSNMYEWGCGDIYGKCSDKITYCASIVKLFIDHFDLDHVFLEYGDATESVDINGQSFDIIMSNLPQVGGWNSKSRNMYHDMEIMKRNKKRRFITEKLNMDINSFENDAQLNSALDLIMDQMNAESSSELSLSGEYESLKDSEYLFLINLINSLTSDGVMVVSIPQSFLFKNSLETLRKYLVLEHFCLDAVIAIPETFSRLKRPEVICIFEKSKSNDDVVFIDISQDVMDNSRVSGSYIKRISLKKENIQKLIRTYKERKSIDRYSRVVKIDEIIHNKFNLSVSRYVDTFEGDFVRLSDLKDEKKEITQNIKELNKKIDEMMDELNLKF